MKERLPAMLLVFATVVALIVNAQGKLINTSGQPSVVSILFGADPNAQPGTLQSWGTFGLAFFGYLIAVSFMNEREAVWFTGLLALGAIYYNEAVMKDQGVISVLFKPGVGSSVAFPGGMPTGGH